MRLKGDGDLFEDCCYRAILSPLVTPLTQGTSLASLDTSPRDPVRTLPCERGFFIAVLPGSRPGALRAQWR
jgi:hypothetical protein